MTDDTGVRAPLPLHQVLLEEFDLQHPDRPLDSGAIAAARARWEARYAGVANAYDRAWAVESGMVGEVYRLIHAAAAPASPGGGVERTALCLSGGGIRSATFGLGVVQGLARRGLLGSFDFLSTVSGGGFLGGWLSSWIARRPGGVEAVEAALAGAPETPLEPEPTPVYHLREYSRYLSPRFGLLSADTWTLVAIFLRNLLLNWMVLIPMLAAALLLPRLGVALAAMRVSAGAATAVLWGSLAAGVVAIAFIVVNSPSLTSTARGRATSRWPPALQGQGAFLGLCLLPLAVMALAATLAWYWMSAGAVPSALHFAWLDWLPFLGGGRLPSWAAFVLYGAGLHVGGFLLSRWWVRRAAPFELVAVLLSGALGGVLAWLAAWLVAARLASGIAWIDPAEQQVTMVSALGRDLYVCGAAPLLLVLFLLSVTVFVGISSKWTSDDDREWLARCAGWMLIWVVVRAFLSALVIFGPLVWFEAGRWTMGVVGGLAGLLTLLLGFRGDTGDRRKGRGEPRRPGERAGGAALAVAAPLFALSILVGLSALTSFCLRFVAERFGHPMEPTVGLVPHGFLNVVAHTPLSAICWVGVALLALGLSAGFFVDINRFSLHGAYRDRLIRAYLGASREPGTRRPNPFTGFDDQDNLELAALRGNRPLHVLNSALNLVHGRELAWQDRKAESFTFSTLHCGYRGGYRSARDYGRTMAGRRISLGTAVAVSGAAASPNMGSHSSPVVTFLLALFNVRLGWWLGNPGPAGNATYDTQGPREAPFALAAETFGLTSNERSYVYLSDGGHFENLGLYEMVLRRCRYIVACDCGQDAELQFQDLGNAISKIRIDLGVPIEFCSLPMRARPDLRGRSYDPAAKPEFPYYALARIRYSCVDALPEAGPSTAAAADQVDGWLLYIKPSLNGTEPADVFHYAKTHPTFPHESTGNQLYSEAQFESYRALASHVVDALPAAPPGDLPALFRELWRIERERHCRHVPPEAGA